MSNTDRYKVVNGRYSRLETQNKGQEVRKVRVRYDVGDTFVPTDEEIEKLGRQITPVQERTRTQKTEDEGSDTTPEPQQSIKHIGGGNYELPNGERVKGKEAAVQRLSQLMQEE